MNSFLCLLLCIYAFIKYLFGYNHNTNIKQYPEFKKYFLRCIFGLLTILTMLGSAFFVLPLFLLYNLVDLYLRIKLIYAYGGLLRGQDSSLVAVRDHSVVRGVVIVNENEDAPDIWKTFLANARKMHESNPKPASLIKHCFGYFYYLRNQVKFEDVVVEQRIGDGDHISKEAFLDFFNNLDHWEDEHRLWTFTYFPQRILWNKLRGTCRQYAFMLSFQHCICDGPNAMKYFIKHFTNDSYKPPQSNYLALLNNLPTFHPDDAYISKTVFGIKNDAELYTPVSSGEQRTYLVATLEETPNYLDLIKKIKSKVGVGFTSVAIDALSCSIRDYFKGKQQPAKDIIYLTTIRPEEINLVFKSSDDDPLINDIGNQLVNIPAVLSTMSIRKRLVSINDTLNLVRRSLESTLLYRLSKIWHIVPSAIAKLQTPNFQDISLITNMSGLENLVFDGHRVENAFFLLSHTYDMPFTFCVMSLDGKLQLTLRSTDKYVSTREDLQGILDGTLRYIDKYAEELQIL